MPVNGSWTGSQLTVYVGHREADLVSHPEPASMSGKGVDFVSHFLSSAEWPPSLSDLTV